MPSSYHERNLPHWQQDDAALFLTWCLKGAKRQKPDIIGLPSGQAFAIEDRELARAKYGPVWLEDTRVAQVVADALLYAERELQLYKLLAWVIMPNHVHVLIDPIAELSRITTSIKTFSARRANEILGHTGQSFWENESYDHWVRNQAELARIVDYIENNPVKARFVDAPQNWRWSSAWAGQEARPTMEAL